MTLSLQFGYLAAAFGYLPVAHALVFAREGGDYGSGVVLLKHRDDVVGKLIHGVNGAGANVEHNVVAEQFILMNHRISPY